MLEKLPKGSPSKPDFYEAVSLKDSFPAGGTMSFSKDYPDFIRVLDFMTNTMSLPIVSGKVRQVFTSLGMDRCEFLPVTIQDHKGQVASKDHCIVNVLDVQDTIDMERSEYELSPFDESQISRIKRLVVKKEGIDPKALFFRARTSMRELFMHESLHEALVQAGVTGFKSFPAEGWNGFDI
ncbi:imm11 family protein [Archangium gephyra]|uniref:imm11 family protein n=1 Tax=Archangium gephyra TaxID=48 RepID=UPI003B78668E